MSYDANGEEIYAELDETKMDAPEYSGNDYEKLKNPSSSVHREGTQGVEYEMLGKRGQPSVYDKLGPGTTPDEYYLAVAPPPPLEEYYDGTKQGYDNAACDEYMQPVTKESEEYKGQDDYINPEYPIPYENVTKSQDTSRNKNDVDYENNIQTNTRF